MPYKPPGKRVSVYLTDDAVKIAKQIDNFSGFVQLCLEDAAGIMAWAILRSERPEKYKKNDNLEEVKDKFNREINPVDPLTAKRTGKQTWPVNSQKKQELW